MYVFEGSDLVVDLFEFKVQEVGDFLLLVKILVEFSTFCFIDEVENTRFVESGILLPHELKVGLAVGLKGKVIVLDLGEIVDNLPLIIIDQLLDLSPEFVIEGLYLGKVRRDG